MADPRFLAVKDVAEALQVRVSSVHGLIKRAELRALQIGGRGDWRIGRDDLATNGPSRSGLPCPKIQVTAFGAGRLGK